MRSKFAILTASSAVHQLGGIDGARVFGLVLVFWQHLMTICDTVHLTEIGPFSVGQGGVGLFLGISGLLAATSAKSANSWLLSRVSKIYPAFWIALAASFLLSAAFNYKQFNFFQVISQFIGTGLFTHPNNLVNSPTWFISLLLAMYLVTYIAMLTKHASTIMLTSSVVLLIYSLTVSSSLLPAHALTYTVSYVCAKNTVLFCKCGSWIALTGLFLIAAIWRPELAYTAFALLVIGLIKNVPLNSKALDRVNKVSYEFYLVHGVILVGLGIYFKASIPVMAIIGFTTSLAAAYLLQTSAQRLSSAIKLSTAFVASQCSRAFAHSQSVL